MSAVRVVMSVTTNLIGAVTGEAVRCVCFDFVVARSTGLAFADFDDFDDFNDFDDFLVLLAMVSSASALPTFPNLTVVVVEGPPRAFVTSAGQGCELTGFSRGDDPGLANSLQKQKAADDIEHMARHDSTNTLAAALGQELADRRGTLGLSPQKLAVGVGRAAASDPGVRTRPLAAI